VHETIELGPVARQVGEQLFNLLVAAHIAIEHQIGAKVCCKFGDPVLETLAHIAEGQLGALCMASLGDAVGNRAVGQHAGDQQFFACEETCLSCHGSLL